MLFMVGLMLVGCDGGSIVGPESMRVRAPQVGTTFFYESYQIDRYENRVSGTTNQYTKTVLASDTVLFGKSDVFILRNQYSDTTFLEYFTIDIDQNLLQRITLGNSAIWMKVPMTTLAESKDTIRTLIDMPSGKRGSLEYAYMHTYYGDQSFTLDTLTLSGRKFRSTLKYQAIASGKQEYAGEIESIDHYLPSLGILAESKTPASYDAVNDRWMNGYVILLQKSMVE
jgi:hypothetical protein